MTPKVGVFMDHFIEPNPIDTPEQGINHPTNKEIEINEWLQCKEYPIIFTVNFDNQYFYCSHQTFKRWCRISHTFGNIRSHIKRKHLLKNTEIRDLADFEMNLAKDSVGNVLIPEEIDRFISSRIKRMILKTGRPFSTVEDEDIKGILKCLGTRQNLAQKCEEIASLIKSSIKYILASSSFISVSVDEWPDLSKRRYLGVTVRCIYNGIPHEYF